MSLATATDSWCHTFINTASGINVIVKNIKKYADAVVKNYTVYRHRMNLELRENLVAQRLHLKREVTDLLDSYAKDRFAASRILAEMRKRRKH